MKKTRSPAPAVDATREKMGSDRPPLWDPEDLDIEEGTTSSGRLRGKPERGSTSRKGT
ncbi:MAG: hypothetical protein WDA16_00895 [Candidatus Thermoplasmatota archaeon]